METVKLNTEHSEVKQKLNELKEYREKTFSKTIGKLSIFAVIIRQNYIESVCSRAARKEWDSEDVSFLSHLYESEIGLPSETLSKGISAIGDMMVSGNRDGCGLEKEDCESLGYLLEDLGGMLYEYKQIAFTITFALGRRLVEEMKRREGESANQ